MPTAADVSWVDVLPSMKNFLPQLRQQANSAANQAGGSAGRSFGDAFGDSAKASVEAAQSKLVAAQKKAADATGALTVAQAKLEDTRKRASVSAGTLAAAEERVAKAQRTVEQQTSGVARAENQLAVASAYASRESDNLGNSLKRQSVVSKAFSGTVSALGAVVQRAWLPVSAALGAAGTIGIKTAAQLEQSRIAFTNMLGSAQAADAFLRKLSDFAAKTPFEFSDVTRASQRLMAMGIAADDVIPYLTAIGDTVSAMGGSAEQVDQVTTAIGQMAAKGRIQSDELLQLTEAGIPALKILAAEYGVTTGEMQDMITKGQVLSADALPKLIDGMENGTAATQAFGGMMAQQSQSLTGLWSTFKDTVKANLAQAFTPLIPLLKQSLAGSTTLVGDWLGKFQKWATNLVGQIPNLIGSLVDSDTQGIAEVLDNIFGNSGRFVGPIREVFSVLFKVKDAAVSLLPSVKNLGSIFGQVGGTISGLFLESVGEIATIMTNQLAPILNKITGWLKDHMGVVWGLVAAYGALRAIMAAHAAALAVEAAGGLVAYIKQVRVVQAVTKAWAAVQWLINAAMDANPIVLIVTALVALGAALYVAWTHSETFRNIVTGVFSAIGDAASWLWNTILKPTWDALVTAWNAVSSAIQWTWANVIKPTWDAVSGAVTWLWSNILSPIFSAISAAWNAVATAIGWAWDNILKPVWDVISTVAMVLYRILVVVVFGAIVLAWELLVTTIKNLWEHVLQPAWEAVAAAASWLWDNVLKPIWAGMQAGWEALLTAVVWVWDHVLHPAWVAVETAANWLWDNVLQPIWGAMQAAWDALLTGMQWAWDNILHPVWVAVETAIGWLWDNVLSPIWTAISTAWDALMNGMRALYDNVLHPMWKVFTDALGAVKTAFDTVKSGIETVWNAIMDIVATPINFVIEIVFNRGLFSAWNWIVDHLGLPASWHAPHWDQLSRGQHFAEGGTIPGQSPTPTADNIPIWATAGEFMQPVPTVDYYGTDAMEAVRQRKAAIYYARGGQIGAVPGFATGGQLFSAVQNAGLFPGVRLTSGYRPGANDYHGRNMAADIAGPQPTPNGSLLLASIEQWIATKYGKGTTELIYDGSGNRQADLYHGAPHTYSAATQAQHHNHVHWAMEGALANALGSAGGGGGIITNAGAEDPWYVSLWHDVTGAYNWFTDHIKAAGEMVAKFGSNDFVQMMAKAPASMLGMLWGTVKDKVADLFLNGQNPGDTEGVKNAVSGILQNRGWQIGSQQWPGVDFVIGHESSWNPKAQNPSSTASGLGQFIDGTWRAYRPIGASSVAHMKDARVVDQAQAFGHYVADVYGTPNGAKAFWQSHHWYGLGGLIGPQPTLLDAGGLWSSGTLGLNLSGGDERVLTPTQDDYWTRFVDVADRTVDVGGGRRALIERVEITMPQANPYEVIDELEHRLHVADLGGRYAWADAP